MHKTHENRPLYGDAALYESSSGIRQKADAEWVLSLLPAGRFRNCLDLACGGGNFLAELVASGRVEKEVVGLDKSKEMVRAAKERLQAAPSQIKVQIDLADVLDFPSYRERFDLVTFLAAVHWVYPEEARVFSWIRGLLSEGGLFGLTTYHPSLNREFCGGSDMLALEVLSRIGGPTRFPPDFLTMGRRTRSPNTIREMLRTMFETVSEFENFAVTKVATAEQYRRFHEATFGEYYSKPLKPELKVEYRRVLGELAMERMESAGFVTSMEIRLWTCGI